MNTIPLTHLIHSNNHTQTARVCTIDSNHSMGQSIAKELNITSNNMIFNNLNPGIYCANFNGEKYYFDLYIAVLDMDELYIVNKNTAYASVDGLKYPINLYKKISSNLDSPINNTVNDTIDMIVIDGMSTKILDEPNYSLLRSMSGFRICTGDSPIIKDDGYLDIYLKNNVKSLPNGVKDTFILNSEQQQHHLIYRIGRRVLSGSENLDFLENLSDKDYNVFFLSDSNVKLENSYNNLTCSHFDNIKSSDLINKNNKITGIATGFGSYGNGFFIKVPTNLVEFNVEDPARSFKDWLFNELQSNRPFIIEYSLEEFRYRTVYLDEYHINTYYPKTYIGLNNFYNISVFYKAYNL